MTAEFSPNKPHRTVLEIARYGVQLEVDEIDLDFYHAAPDSVEVIADLEKVTPDPASPALKSAMEKARELCRNSQGEELVNHWLDSRTLGRFYRMDIFGLIGLAMIHHPDTLPATQAVINDVERHRRGNLPEGLAETEEPITEVHLRKTLAVLRFNYASDLLAAGQHRKALDNVDASLLELGSQVEAWRILDRQLMQLFLSNVLGESERTQALARSIANDYTFAQVQEALTKWAPVLPGIDQLLNPNS